MKKLFCRDYHLDCCQTCHNDDTLFTRNFKGFEVHHCCGTMYEIEADINKYLESEGLENNCE